MPLSPPIPGSKQPLNDIEGYAYVRRKIFTPRRRHFLRLNGAVLSAYAAPHAPCDWEISVLHGLIEPSSRRCIIMLTCSPSTSTSPPSSPITTSSSTSSTSSPLSTSAASVKLYIQIEERAMFNRWLVAMQVAITRDFRTFYHIKDKIGEGAFASVYRAVCLTTGRWVAVKCVKRKDFDAVTAMELQREMFAMRHLRHLNIVTAHDVFNTPSQVFIVMDLMEGGTMKDNVQAVGGRISEADARPVMRQVLQACAFLHAHGYVHRDVKLENLLCDSTTGLIGTRGGTASCAVGRVRLADFGYVNFLDDPRHPCLRSLLGTPVYIAPEIIQRAPYGCAVDVYAAGVMLYRMISGHYPYDGRDDDDKTLELAVQGCLSFPDAAWRRTSKSCRNFVRALLQPVPERRLTARAALYHPWFTDHEDTDDDDKQKRNLIQGVVQVEFGSHNRDDASGARNGRGETRDVKDGEEKQAHMVVDGACKPVAAIPISPVTPAPRSGAFSPRFRSRFGVPGVNAFGGGCHDGADDANRVADGDGTMAGEVRWIGGGGSTPVVRSVRVANPLRKNDATYAGRWSPLVRRALARVRIVVHAVTFMLKTATLSGVLPSAPPYCGGSSGGSADARASSSLLYDPDGYLSSAAAATTSPPRGCRHRRYGRLDDEHEQQKEYDDVIVDDAEYDDDDDDDDDEDEDLDNDENREEEAIRRVARSRKKDLRRRSSFVALTRRFARASSFSRPRRANRFGALGDRLKRTMSMGPRR